MLSINEFKTRSNIPASLIDAVIDYLPHDPETDLEELAGTLHDVATCGAAGGFGNFIYYADTCKFTNDNLHDIMQYAESQAQELGTDVLTMIAGFNCLGHVKGQTYRNNPTPENMIKYVEDGISLTPHDVAKALYQSPRNDDQECNQTAVLNALAWYALEEVARQYVDISEQESDD